MHESCISLSIVSVIRLFVAVIITFFVRKIHRVLVFVLPRLLTLFTAALALHIWSDEAGFEVIFLVGFMIISGVFALIA